MSYKAKIELIRMKEINAELLEVLEKLEPFFDAIVCYASTMEEHEPNRLVMQARAVIIKAKENVK